jgi:hypothetical protein
MLLTGDAQSLRKNGKLPERLGIRFYGLKDLDALLVGVAHGAVSMDELERMTRCWRREIAMGAAVPRRLARFDELKLLSPTDDRFARVHSGRDPASGDRAIIHSYDLSAAPSGVSNPENLARREFDVVQKLQKSPYLPSLVDSWQESPNYAGEMYFFTLAESGAAKLGDLVNDPCWALKARLIFAARALRALAELQAPAATGGEAVACRSSRFSRSRAFSRSATSVGMPTRLPLSTSPFLIHSSSVCGEQPILAVIDETVAHRDACSPS